MPNLPEKAEIHAPKKDQPEVTYKEQFEPETSYNVPMSAKFTAPSERLRNQRPSIVPEFGILSSQHFIQKYLDDSIPMDETITDEPTSRGLAVGREASAAAINAWSNGSARAASSLGLRRGTETSNKIVRAPSPGGRFEIST
jgi:hypothetical protein